MRSLGFAALFAVLLAPRLARAQTFPPDAQWVPLTCGGQVATDPVGDVGPGAIDVVGDATDPAAYVFMDASWLYLRLRTSATALQDPTTYEPYAWACLIRTSSTPNSYLVWDGVDGLATPNAVDLLQNATPQILGNPTRQPANTVVTAYGVATSAREVAASGQLGGFFIDWAVALSDLSKVGITASTPMQFLCGTSKTERILDADLVGQQQACGGLLDTVACLGGPCGTCTTATACGPGCDSCGGATPVCNPTYGCTVACTRDAQCGGATPFCDTSSGTCIPCAQAGPSCTRGGTGSSSGNVAGQETIEGGSFSCDAVAGREANAGTLAGLAVGVAAVLAARARRSR